MPSRMRRSMSAIATTLLSVLSVAVTGHCSTGPGRWLDIWGSMPQLCEPANLPPAPFNQTGVVFNNATLRQTVRVTLDAPVIRLHISNAFGGTDLPVTAVTVARPTNGTAGIANIDPDGGLHKVTFSGGSPGFTIPNGALVVSDPVNFPVKAMEVITVSIYLASGQLGNSITSHPGSRTTSWFAPGDAVEAVDFAGREGVDKVDHWYFLSRVEGWRKQKLHDKPESAALTIIGDSITDGRGSTHNVNNRWPDVLTERLVSAKVPVSVINQAAGGNRVLRDGLGPNALGRIDRDAIAGSGTRYVIIFEGVNDIGTASPEESAQVETEVRVTAAYRQMVTRLHAHGIAVFGATITPMTGPGQAYGQYPIRERTRTRINKWIRESGVFDAVIDFDKLVRDPANATMLAPQYDVGDYLHLNPTGYKAMGESVDLRLFEKFKDGVWGIK